MMIVAIASGVAVVCAVVIVAVLLRSKRPDERRRKTMLIGVALPFVRSEEPAFVAPPSPPVTEPVVAPQPVDDDGPTTADPRRAQIVDVPEPPPSYPRRLPRASSAPIEGPTIRGPGIPPPRPEPARARDAKLRAAIRANTLHATIKPKR